MISYLNNIFIARIFTLVWLVATFSTAVNAEWLYKTIYDTFKDMYSRDTAMAPFFTMLKNIISLIPGIQAVTIFGIVSTIGLCFTKFKDVKIPKYLEVLFFIVSTF